MKRVFLCITLCLAGGGPPASAEPVTRLEQAVRYTVERNFELRASAQRITTAETQVRLAEAAGRPQVVFRYGLQTSDNPLDAFAELLNTRSVTAEDFDPHNLNNPDISALFSGGVALQYSLYNGGRVQAEIEGAAHNTEAARLQHARLLQHAIYDTVRAYYAAQSAERGVAIGTDAEAAARRHARTTRQLVREDRTVQSDQLTAEVNWSAFKSLSAQSRTRLALAYNRLKLAMGMPQQQPLSVPPLDEPSAAPPLPDVGVHEQRALQSRSDLLALLATLRTAQAQTRSAQAQMGPRVELTADTTLYEDHPFVDELSWRVMGVVTKDLYTGGRTRSAVDIAQSRAQTLQFQIASLRQSIVGEVRVAVDNIKDSVERLKIATGNTAKARRNVKLISERYGQGRTILIDLLGAEQRLVEARNEELLAHQSLLTNVAALSLADGSLATDAGFGSGSNR